VDQAAWVGFQDQVGFQALRVALVVPALAAHRDAQADSQGREVEALRRAQASQEVAESTKSNSPRKAIQKSNSEKQFRKVIPRSQSSSRRQLATQRSLAAVFHLAAAAPSLFRLSEILSHRALAARAMGSDGAVVSFFARSLPTPGTR
jgi:hypothetical protein